MHDYACCWTQPIFTQDIAKLHVTNPRCATWHVDDIFHGVQGIIHMEHWVEISIHQAAKWETWPFLRTAVDCALLEEPRKGWEAMIKSEPIRATIHKNNTYQNIFVNMRKRWEFQF